MGLFSSGAPPSLAAFYHDLATHWRQSRSASAQIHFWDFFAYKCINLDRDCSILLNVRISSTFVQFKKHFKLVVFFGIMIRTGTSWSLSVRIPSPDESGCRRRPVASDSASPTRRPRRSESDADGPGPSPSRRRPGPHGALPSPRHRRAGSRAGPGPGRRRSGRCPHAATVTVTVPR